MDVKSFVVDAFEKKLESLGFNITENQLQQILSTFDLDAVQDYIDEEIRKRQVCAKNQIDKCKEARKAELYHRMKLKKIAEQWAERYSEQLGNLDDMRMRRLNQQRKRLILDEFFDGNTVSNEDIKKITASIKMEALSCDAYPCQK